MKKYLVLLFGIILLFSSCDKGGGSRVEDTLANTIWSTSGMRLEFLGNGKVACFASSTPQYGNYKMVYDGYVGFDNLSASKTICDYFDGGGKKTEVEE